MADGANIRIEYVDPGDLVPATYNPRTITDAALRRLARLLDVHGFVDPIIARRQDKLIIGGHQRLRANAMRERPDPLVPVVFVAGVSDAKAKALNIALNNTEAQGEYDQPKLADLLIEIDTDEFDVPEVTGFAATDIASLLGELDDVVADPAIPEAYQVVVQCDSEDDQRATYERLTGEGLMCRLLTL